MVSYYNTLPYTQKHSAANLAYPTGQPWQWTANYHTPPNHQFLSDMDSSHAAAHHQMYYNHHMFHPTPGSVSEWHSPTTSAAAAAADNFTQNNVHAAHQMLHSHQTNVSSIGSAAGNSNVGIGNGNVSTGSLSSGSSTASAGPTTGNTQINDSNNGLAETHISPEGLPSPPITISGSEISSPGVPASSSSPHHAALHLSNSNNNNNNNSPAALNSSSGTHNANINNNNNTINNNRASPAKTQYYEWMKKPAYPAQPTPGKTRTKDKYRVVYTDYQRLELEKEYCTSRYITIRRKTELAQSLSLSERQVKIWFQNRRAKERKQTKKGMDPVNIVGGKHSDYPNLMDPTQKLETGLHLQHSLHSMSSMGSMGSMAVMGMPRPMTFHHLHNLSHPHHLQQSTQSQMSAAVASVGSLSM